MKPLTRFAAVLATAAAVLLSAPGCERRPAATAKMFVEEGAVKANHPEKFGAEDSHGKKGHGDKKAGDAHPPAAAASPSPQKFIAPNK